MGTITLKIEDIIETLVFCREEQTEKEFKAILFALKVTIDDKDTWRTIIYALKERIGK